MKKAVLFSALVLELCGFFSVLSAQSAPVTTQPLNKMPLAFTKNMGQWDEEVQYRTSSGGATIWICKDKIVYQFLRTVANNSKKARGIGSLDSEPTDRLLGERDSLEQLVITAKFVGANPDVQVIGEALMEYKCNYFIGNDPSKWHADVPNYEEVTLRDIYPRIDVKFYSSDGGNAVCEILPAEGANISGVKIEYDGAIESSVDDEGRLFLNTEWGSMIAGVHSPLVGMQCGSTSLLQLPKQTIGIDFIGAVQQMMEVSSPGLVFSTFLGDGGEDLGSGIAVDSGGCAYVVGYTASASFPTQNPYQGDNGSNDVFVTKFSNSGTALIYSTYLGGNDVDRGSGIAIGADGSAYLTGYARSTNFPTVSPFDSSMSGNGDAFVTKLTPEGNGLVYSTYLGGSSNSGDWGYGIAVDSSGSSYVTGFTYSTDFPTVSPIDATLSGITDAFVTKFSPSGNSLVYSTYLGGSGNSEVGHGIAVDSKGCAYVTGSTVSLDFPTVVPLDSTMSGDGDAFVTKFSPTGSSMVYSTYLGGSRNLIGENGFGIAVDATECAYVTGTTASVDFPTTNPFQSTLRGGQDAFVTKFSPSGSSLIYSTYLGGGNNGETSGYGIAVDSGGWAYVTGKTSSSSFPIANALDDQLNGGNDAFLSKLSAAGNSLVASTYLGGSNYETGSAIAVDWSGNAYVTGHTESADFPVHNPFDGSYNGGTVTAGDVFVTKMNALICGDADGNGIVTISDVVYLINHVFSGGPAPYPLLSGDANCSGTLNISDAVYLINYIFSGGAAPCSACP